jgi:hypothetical protein
MKGGAKRKLGNMGVIRIFSRGRGCSQELFL